MLSRGVCGVAHAQTRRRTSFWFQKKSLNSLRSYNGVFVLRLECAMCPFAKPVAGPRWGRRLAWLWALTVDPSGEKDSEKTVISRKTDLPR